MSVVLVETVINKKVNDFCIRFFIELFFSFIIGGSYADIIVSVIFGFLNFLLWLGSIWFVYKETKFFKSRTAQQQPPPKDNFSNVSPPIVQQ